MGITGLKLGKVVYVMAPMTIYRDERQYLEPVNRLQNLFPHIRFLRPDILFASNDDWLINFARYAKSAKSALLLTDNGIIGKGCYDEMRSFHNLRKPVWCVCPHHSELRFHSTFFLECLPGNNWQRYAYVTLFKNRQPDYRLPAPGTHVSDI